MLQSTNKLQIVCSICTKASTKSLTAKLNLYRGADREDVDDENISVTRTNSTSRSRCSSTYRSRSRSPTQHDEEGVLNLDTKSTKIISAISVPNDPSAYDEAKSKPPSEQQSRLEEAYHSSIEHQLSSKPKCKRFIPSEDCDQLPSPHEQNGYGKCLESIKHTKVRRNTHKDDSAIETFGVRDKLPLLQLNYMEHLDRLKSTLPLPSANFQLPSPLPLNNADTVRLYQPFLYPYLQPSGSDHSLGLFPNHFMTYQPHPLLFPDSYRKEPSKVVSPTSPSRTSPPKAGTQLYLGTRGEPGLPTQSSVAPIH